MKPTKPKTLHLSDFKAILFDIDRTLIPPNREIFPEVIEMIKQLKSKGIITGVCTGRGYASIVNKFMPLFPDNSIHVMAGGSLVISNSGKIIWQQTIDPTTIDELKEIIKNSNLPAVFMKPDAQYAEKEVLKNIQAHPWQQITKNLNTMTSDGVGLIYVVKPNNKITEYLKNHPKLSFKNMTNSNGQQYYDITAKGVTKAKAIEEWSKTTNIPTSQIIGFGDSLNDLEFLQSCGFSVAMGNAEPEIKVITNKTIGNVTQKSLPNYVQTILKGNPL